MNFDKFKPQLGGWAEMLQPFIVSKECDRIYAKLKEDSKKGIIICPDSTDTFRAFKECPFEDLKVVLIGQDPYPWVKEGVKVADGLAFSCKWTGLLQPSLDTLYRGIEDDLYGGLNLNMYKNPDLTEVANQGVLLLNSSLTVRKDMISSHKHLWKDFIEYTIKIICLAKEGVIFLLLGDCAREYEQYIDKKHHFVYTCEHPSAANRQHRKWFTDHIFYLTEQTLIAQNKPPINWIYETAPF